MLYPINLMVVDASPLFIYYKWIQDCYKKRILHFHEITVLLMAYMKLPL